MADTRTFNSVPAFFMRYLMKKKVIIAGVITNLLILASCILVLINQPVDNLDELWNYNFSRCMYKGMLPYKDFSMITMPLSPLLMALAMYIFGDGLIVYRISGIILNVIISIVVYIVFNRLLKDRYIIAACFTVMIMMLLLPEFRYDYNYLNMLLILIVILMNINKSDTYRHAALIGLVSGLTLCVKQTTGICVITANIITSYILNRKCNYDIKKTIVRCVMSVVPAIFLAGYIVVTGITGDFISYCAKGVATFNNTISYAQFMLSSPFNMAVGVIFPFIIMWLIYISIKNKESYIWMYIIYAFAGCVVMYPITDNYHFYIGAVPVFIIFLGTLDFKKSGKIENIICAAIAFVILMTSTVMLYPKGNYIKSQLPVYKGLNISGKLEQKIINVDSYIMLSQENGKEAYLVDSAAAAYTIPLNRYTKDMDMLLIGNTGGKDIMNFDIDYDNVRFMLNPHVEQLNWQFDKKWYELITTQYKKIGEECGFDIYEKKD